MRQTILITGIGGDISQGAATILKEARPEYRLIGVDIHDRHCGHLYVDQFDLVPAASSPDYQNAIRSVAAKYSANVVIPMSEPELDALQPFSELAPGVKWIYAGDQVVCAGLDKLQTVHALEQLGLPVPWSMPVNQGYPQAYPCILKNRFGSGSRAVFKVSNDEDVDYLVKRYPDAIFQEMLEPADREVTCAVYRRCDGMVASLLMLRRLIEGATSWARIIRDEETSRMCEAIAVGLDLCGSMNIQLRITEKGPRVFEINPRFSSTILMRHRIGFSDLLWALDEAEGKSVTFPEIPYGRIVVRVQGAAVC